MTVNSFRRIEDKTVGNDFDSPSKNVKTCILKNKKCNLKLLLDQSKFEHVYGLSLMLAASLSISVSGY